MEFILNKKELEPFEKEFTYLNPSISSFPLCRLFESDSVILQSVFNNKGLIILSPELSHQDALTKAMEDYYSNKKYFNNDPLATKAIFFFNGKIFLILNIIPEDRNSIKVKPISYSIFVENNHPVIPFIMRRIELLTDLVNQKISQVFKKIGQEFLERNQLDTIISDPFQEINGDYICSECKASGDKILVTENYIECFECGNIQHL